jgi:FdhE protein
MTRPRLMEAWLEAHSYLQPVADFCERVDRVAAGLEITSPSIPDWEDYAADFREGVPLLQSASAAPDLGPAGTSIVALVQGLAARPHSASPAGSLAAEVSALDADLRREDDLGRRAVAWLLGDDAFAPASPGLLRHLGWTVLARSLAPVVAAFGSWRDDERWLRHYCPTCGSAPAMAQLVGADAGRKRLLSCGCCGTRWEFRRTKCPFCEADSQRLASMSVGGEPGLRIDHCEACGGYLKTYDGQGGEDILLADWTTLHLDLLAQDRGLKRLAASLYDLDAAPVSSA